MFLRFVIVGGTGFVTDFAVLLLMLRLGFSPMPGRVISVSAALLATFFLNRNFTFQNRATSILRQFVRYIMASLLGIAINIASFRLFLYYFSPEISLIFASAIALVSNFTFYKYIVFRRADSHLTDSAVRGTGRRR